MYCSDNLVILFHLALLRGAFSCSFLEGGGVLADNTV